MAPSPAGPSRRSGDGSLALPAHPRSPAPAVTPGSPRGAPVVPAREARNAGLRTRPACGPVVTRMWWRLVLARAERVSRGTGPSCSRRTLSHRLVGWCGDQLSGLQAAAGARVASVPSRRAAPRGLSPRLSRTLRQDPRPAAPGGRARPARLHALWARGTRRAGPACFARSHVAGGTSAPHARRRSSFCGPSGCTTRSSPPSLIAISSSPCPASCAGSSESAGNCSSTSRSAPPRPSPST